MKISSPLYPPLRKFLSTVWKYLMSALPVQDSGPMMPILSLLWSI